MSFPTGYISDLTIYRAASWPGAEGASGNTGIAVTTVLTRDHRPGAGAGDQG